MPLDRNTMRKVGRRTVRSSIRSMPLSTSGWKGELQAALFHFPNFRAFKTVNLLNHIFLPCYFKFDSISTRYSHGIKSVNLKKIPDVAHKSICLGKLRKCYLFNSYTTAAAWGRKNKLGRTEGMNPAADTGLWNLDWQMKQQDQLFTLTSK